MLNTDKNLITGKHPGKRFTLPILLLMLFSNLSIAQPQGAVVTAGAVTMVSSAGTMIINQATQNAVINWQHFNIGHGEAVHFVQPDNNSVALNRVLGTDPSTILGSLTANGKVFLVNPNGILFAAGATVNVAGLVASTLDISDRDFLAGNYKFSGTGESTTLNSGSINTNADGGYVVLLGANANNDGTITAQLGTVVLAAGSAFTFDMAGDGLLNVGVDRGTMNALVQNGGWLQADGGKVVLTTQAAGNILQSTVNNSGVIQAQTLLNHKGTIRLLADQQSGTVQVNGSLLAQGGTLSGDGGLIETSAAHVLISEHSKIDTTAVHGNTGLWLLDPVNWTIATAGGDETPASVVASLATSNRSIDTSNDITVAAPVSWTSAQTLILNAGHDVLINAPLNAITAGSGLVLTAGNNVNSGAALTVTAANSSIKIAAINDVQSTAAIMAVAADSKITITAGNDIHSGGIITATAANSLISLTAGRDLTTTAAINAVAADSLISLNAGRDVTTVAAMLATAAGTAINLNAGRSVKINAAIAASAAGSSISLIAGLGSNEPGVASGTVLIGAAVASLNTLIRFNPNGYAKSNAEMAAYATAVTGPVDAKAWVFAQGDNKVYDANFFATLSLKGNPAATADVSISSGTAYFDNSSAGLNKSVSFNGSVISGADSGKFVLVNNGWKTTANITPAPLLITALGINKIYDGSAAATVTLANQHIAGDAVYVTYLNAKFSNTNVGNDKVVNVTGINVSGVDAANYSFSTVAATTANITPAPLTIKAANATKIYGQGPTLSSFTQTGLIGNETIINVIESSAGTAATAGVANGPYTITPANASGGTFKSSNYNIIYINGALTVNPANLQVTLANATKPYGKSIILTAFSVAGLLNGETIGNLSESSPGAAANASLAGSPYLITSSAPGGGTFTPSNYNIVTVNGALTVIPLLQPNPVGGVRSIASLAGNAGSKAILPESWPDELPSIEGAVQLPALMRVLPVVQQSRQ
jgi:filamentous hemagglutinin family protein